MRPVWRKDAPVADRGQAGASSRPGDRPNRALEGNAERGGRGWQTVPMTESSSSPRRSPSRRPPGRNGSGRGSSSPLVELASIETPPELILFNAYLSAEKDVERERQRVRQAEVAKEKAASRLKEAQAGGSREAVAEAEAEYRQRVEDWKRARDGEPAIETDGSAAGEPLSEEPTDESASASESSEDGPEASESDADAAPEASAAEEASEAADAVDDAPAAPVEAGTAGPEGSD